MGRRAVGRRAVGGRGHARPVAWVLAVSGCTHPGAPRPRRSATTAPPACTAATGPPATATPTVEPLPAVADPATTFSFAVVPDTQPEVKADDPRTDKRIAWLVAHRRAAQPPVGAAQR